MKAKNFLMAVAASIATCASASHAKSLEELLAEKGVITKSEAASLSHGSPLPKVYWNDGTRIELPDNAFDMQITTFLKSSYIYTNAPRGQEDMSSFDVRNARLVVSGHALSQEFMYKLEYDAALNKLLDGFIDWSATDWANVKLGQFKTAISRQFVNNSFKLMFPDASYASNYFNFGYQKGAKATVKMLDGKVTAGAGISNGNSDGEGPYATAVDAKNMVIGDVRWSVTGKMNAYEEGDIGNTQDPALNVGAAYAYSPQNTKLGETIEPLTVHRSNVDANFKYRGLGVNAEYYVSDETPVAGESWRTQGAYAQAGYFLVPEKFEVAGRWSTVDCDGGKGLGLCQGVDTYNQATGGLNYYIWKHNLKTQVAYDYLRAEAVDDTSKNQSRYMFQLIGIF